MSGSFLPSPWSSKQPQSTRVKEPTLLCNHHHLRRAQREPTHRVRSFDAIRRLHGMVAVACSDECSVREHKRCPAADCGITGPRIRHVRQDSPGGHRPVAVAGARNGHALGVFWSPDAFAGGHRTLRLDGSRRDAKDTGDGDPRGSGSFARERAENDSARNARPCSWWSTDWTALRACRVATHFTYAVWTFAE